MKFFQLVRKTAVLATVLALGACGGGADDPKTFNITYRVDSPQLSPVSVTFQNATGGTSQQMVTPGWTTVFSAPAGQFLYLSGQTNSSATNASVTVTIFANGGTFKTTTSSGAFSIATASGGCC